MTIIYCGIISIYLNLLQKQDTPSDFGFGCQPATLDVALRPIQRITRIASR